MTKDELIAKQQIAIEELQERLERLDAAIRNAVLALKGLLNDSRMESRPAQRELIWRVIYGLDV